MASGRESRKKRQKLSGILNFGRAALRAVRNCSAVSATSQHEFIAAMLATIHFAVGLVEETNGPKCANPTWADGCYQRVTSAILANHAETKQWELLPSSYFTSISEPF
jgi:hypothetical protein